MQLLRRAGLDPDRVRAQVAHPVIDRRDVGRGVIETAVAFLNDAGPLRQLGDVAEENADRAFADFREAGLAQPLDHAGQAIVVETFPALDVVVDVEDFVGGFEFLHRKRDALVPDAQVFLVAGLQPNEFAAAGVAHLPRPLLPSSLADL